MIHKHPPLVFTTQETSHVTIYIHIHNTSHQTMSSQVLVSAYQQYL